jgi:hypothetical protein
VWWFISVISALKQHVILVLGRQRWEFEGEFEATLDYIASSKSA